MQNAAFARAAWTGRTSRLTSHRTSSRPPCAGSRLPLRRRERHRACKVAVARIVGSELPSVNTLVGLKGYLDRRRNPRRTARERPAIIGDGGAAAAFRHARPQARTFSRRGDWPPDVRDADLVVHATSVRDEVLAEVGEGQTLIDLPYPRTATAEAAAAAGARVLDGLDVLLAQGAASFELWTGIPAPIEVMRAALRNG